MRETGCSTTDKAVQIFGDEHNFVDVQKFVEQSFRVVDDLVHSGHVDCVVERASSPAPGHPVDLQIPPLEDGRAAVPLTKGYMQLMELQRSQRQKKQANVAV